MDLSKDIRYGDHLLRIRKVGKDYVGIIVGEASTRYSAPTAEEVRNLLVAAVNARQAGFIGLNGARSRFLELFPLGFSDPAYLGDRLRGERSYKLAAAEFLAERLPVENIGRESGQGEIALRAYQRTNLLDRFSKAKISDVLRGPRSAAFLAIARDFCEGSVQSACRHLQCFREEGVATWVCLTYLPFFWRPDRHCFLKPDFTRDFARRIGHEFQFAYESIPNAESYASLIDMIATLRNSVSDLGPRDNIDLHSFMWATIGYTDEDVEPI